MATFVTASLSTCTIFAIHSFTGKPISNTFAWWRRLDGSAGRKKLPVRDWIAEVVRPSGRGTHGFRSTSSRNSVTAGKIGRFPAKPTGAEKSENYWRSNGRLNRLK
jgi:hypothetical protein